MGGGAPLLGPFGVANDGATRMQSVDSCSISVGTDLAGVGSSIRTDAAGAAIPVGALVGADAVGARRAGARRDSVLADGGHLLQVELARCSEGRGRRRPPAPGEARAAARGPWPANPGLRRARDEREHAG
jgi:hypothetical protein